MTTRFLILGMGRTGSNLLQSLLASHPAATCYGELFNASNADQVLWQTARTSTAEQVAARDVDPVAFLEQQVFGAVDPGIRAVGFKLFYYHARDGAWAPIWPWLAQQQDLVILHLRRRNMLKRIVSEKLAERSGKWSTTDASQAHDDVQIELDVEQCRAAFERMRGWEQAGDAFFANHRIVQLTYEELAADPAGVMADVLETLDLPDAQLSSPMKKQTRRPTHEVVSNFDALRTSFAGTDWESFFVRPGS